MQLKIVTFFLVTLGISYSLASTLAVPVAVNDAVLVTKIGTPPVSETRIVRDALGNQATAYAYHDGHSSSVVLSRTDVDKHLVAVQPVAPLVVQTPPAITYGVPHTGIYSHAYGLGTYGHGMYGNGPIYGGYYGHPVQVQAQAPAVNIEPTVYHPQPAIQTTPPIHTYGVPGAAIGAPIYEQYQHAVPAPAVNNEPTTYTQSVLIGGHGLGGHGYVPAYGLGAHFGYGYGLTGHAGISGYPLNGPLYHQEPVRVVHHQPAPVQVVHHQPAPVQVVQPPPVEVVHHQPSPQIVYHLPQAYHQTTLYNHPGFHQTTLYHQPLAAAAYSPAIAHHHSSTIPAFYGRTYGYGDGYEYGHGYGYGNGAYYG